MVFIMPAKEGRGPVHFPVQGERHDAAYVYDRLRSAFGAGDLQDPDVIEVMYDPSYELGPGNYLYILVGQGKIHRTSVQITKAQSCLPSRGICTVADDFWSHTDGLPVPTAGSGGA